MRCHQERAREAGLRLFFHHSPASLGVLGGARGLKATLQPLCMAVPAVLKLVAMRRSRLVALGLFAVSARLFAVPGGNLKYSSRDYKYDLAEQQPETEALSRDVVVNDVRDLNELLKMNDPICPDDNVLLMAVTLDNGTRIERPTAEDLKVLKPTKLRPVVFHWKDMSALALFRQKERGEARTRRMRRGITMSFLALSSWFSGMGPGSSSAC